MLPDRYEIVSGETNDLSGAPYGEPVRAIILEDPVPEKF